MIESSRQTQEKDSPITHTKFVWEFAEYIFSNSFAFKPGSSKGSFLGWQKTLISALEIALTRLGAEEIFIPNEFTHPLSVHQTYVNSCNQVKPGHLSVPAIIKNYVNPAKELNYTPNPDGFVKKLI